jgi:lactoylglutathione lyase
MLDADCRYLRHHRRHLAGAIEARQRPMAPARLGVAELVAHGEATPPGFVTRFLARQEFIERNGPILGPNPPRRAEIGDTAFGRDTGTGKRQDDFGLPDHVPQACRGAGEIGRVHPFDPHAAALHIQRRTSGSRSNTSQGAIMRYLHTMLRVRNLDAALDFYCNKLGLKEVRRRVDEKNKYTLVFLAAPDDSELVAKGPDGRAAPLVELTYNWDSGEDYGEARYFGHLAYEVDDIYALCDRLMKAGVTINRPPRDGMMAFVRSPDKQSIELLQKGAALPPQEPWKSMPNTGHW